MIMLLKICKCKDNNTNSNNNHNKAFYNRKSDNEKNRSNNNNDNNGNYNNALKDGQNSREKKENCFEQQTGQVYTKKKDAEQPVKKK